MSSYFSSNNFGYDAPLVNELNLLLTDYDGQNQNFNSTQRQEMGMGMGMDVHTSAQGWQGGQMQQHPSMGSASTVQNFQQIQLLHSATHFELMLSGNEVYAKLYNESVMLKCQLEVQKERVLELRADLKESQQSSSANRLLLGDSMALDARNTDRLARANESQPLGLIIPPAPLSLVKEEYPKLAQKFWTKNDWKKYEEAEQNANRIPSKNRYLCDEDGLALSESRIDDMSDAAKLGFNELFFWRLDPKSWGKRVDRANQYFSNTMRIKFPELGLCDGDWKLNEFATDRFPAWNRYHREGKTVTLSRARPSKRKADAVEDNKRVRKEKKRKHTKVPVPAPDVIHVSDTDNPDDIYDDPPQRPQPKASQSAENLPPMAAAQSPADAQTATNCQAGSTPTAAPKSVTPSSNINAAPTITAQTPPSAADATDATDVTTPPSDAAAANKSRPPSPRRESTPTPPTTADVEPPVVALQLPQLQGPEIHKDTSGNPFAGLIIPQPPIQVTETDNEGSTSTAVASGAQGKGKKGKAMVPSPTLLTPRNLYAIDCAKTHPGVTPAEFKEMFRLLDPATLKKYEDMSKERKAAAKAD